MADGAGFWMGVHQILLDVSIAPSYIKFGLNGGIQHPLLKIIEKDFFFKRYTQLDLNLDECLNNNVVEVREEFHSSRHGCSLP